MSFLRHKLQQRIKIFPYDVKRIFNEILGNYRSTEKDNYFGSAYFGLCIKSFSYNDHVREINVVN